MDAADEARLLEEDLEDCSPDERGDFLMEAAAAWRRAGNHERAIQLLTEAVEFGAEGHDSPAVVLAEVLFGLGRDDEARAALRDLRKTWPDSPEPYDQAGDLMRKRGELEEALNWYDLAVARLDPDEQDDSYVTVHRYEVRRTLGLPPDDLDEAIEPLARRMDALVWKALARITVEFWPRTEVPLAHSKWPEVVPHNDPDAATRERELANRKLARTVRRIVMVPLTVASLTGFVQRTGLDPADERTRSIWIREVHKSGPFLAWPPPRNSPCWCGSGLKYKKCCGRPG
jgi:hypothetical protein